MPAGQDEAMVVRTVAFVLVRQVLGLIDLARHRTPRMSRSLCCAINCGYCADR
jgi:hypothetical protein